MAEKKTDHEGQETFKKGDHVEWHGPGKVSGEVEKELTKPTDLAGHHFDASKDEPEYLVKSDKSGKEAIHRPEQLEKKD